MNDIIVEIKNYILFLKKECKLEITLHPVGNERMISDSELILFNIHENPYCVYVKTFPSAFEHCINRQCKVCEKCKTGSFSGTCYAGVREYVYPIYDADTFSGFICVSGYRDSNSNSYIDRCSNLFDMPAETLRKTIQSLKNDLPDKKYVDTLILPLLRMIELAYIKFNDIEKESNIVADIIKYINRHYTENITLEHVCKMFSRSRSYISHTLKKETGKTFHEHLTEVRLSSSKSLLLHSDLRISEIAFSVGFNDSNYFSNTFKKLVGISPSEYKSNHK